MRCRACKERIGEHSLYGLQLLERADEQLDRELKRKERDHFASSLDFRSAAAALVCPALGMHGFCMAEVVGQLAGVILARKEAAHG